MAAFYVDEEEVWKCLKHPSKRHRSGICPTCLRERLSSLCPDCANVRPCACACSAVTSSSSSSSSSFSRFSVSGGENSSAGIGTVGRVSNLIKSEPSFRRSRSVAVPFMRTKSKSKTNFVGNEEISRAKTPAFWGWLKGGNKSSNTGGGGGGGGGDDVEVEEERRMMMRKSRSVSVAVTKSDYGKSKGGAKWYFPSPIKAFRQSKLSKAVPQERSPLYRG